MWIERRYREIFNKVKRVKEETGQRDVVQNYRKDVTDSGWRTPQRGSKQIYSDLMRNMNDRRSNGSIRLWVFTFPESFINNLKFKKYNQN